MTLDHPLYGGRHVPPALDEPLDQLQAAYDDIVTGDEFQAEFRRILREYAGRPTSLTYAETLSERYDADIYLKREDLLHGGAHKLNNTLGQGLLAKQAGKTRLIAETGAGQHGVATAMAGAYFDIPTEIYMGKKDADRQRMNVRRMELLGAEVNEVTRGNQDLATAVDVALEDFVEDVEDTHYLIGSVVGPEPFPRLVREFQAVIGEEARRQMLDQHGSLPDAAVACVGGGSNAIGLFHAFKDDPVDFFGAEGGGKSDVLHAAPLATEGPDEVIHGMMTRVIGDDVEVHSVAAGLDYPGVGPEHAILQDVGRAEYAAVRDEDAMDAFRELCETEGIIPAVESAHAVALARELAAEYDTVLVNVSGRGDKDVGRSDA
jgi:tryptophan synthase beta chain